MAVDPSSGESWGIAMVKAGGRLLSAPGAGRGGRTCDGVRKSDERQEVVSV